MKKLAFGVDIGGINTAFGLVDEKGDLFGESVISTRAYPNYQDYPRYVADLCEAMKLLINAVNFEFELIGIGIGAPNANSGNLQMLIKIRMIICASSTSQRILAKTSQMSLYMLLTMPMQQLSARWFTAMQRV